MPFSKLCCEIWLHFGMSKPDLFLLREPGAFPWTHPWLAEQSCSSPLSWECQPGDHPLGYLLWINPSWRKQSPEWRIPPGLYPALLPYLRCSSCFAPGISPPPFPLFSPLWSGPFGAGIVFLDSLPCLTNGCGLRDITEIPLKSSMIDRFYPTGV